MIISQWVVVRAPDEASVVVNNVIAGGIALICGVAVMGLASMGRKKS